MHTKTILGSETTHGKWRCLGDLLRNLSALPNPNANIATDIRSLDNHGPVLYRFQLFAQGCVTWEARVSWLFNKTWYFCQCRQKKKKNPEVCNSFLIWAKKKEFCIPWAKSSLHYCANIERKWLASKFIAPASKLCIFSELLLTT